MKKVRHVFGFFILAGTVFSFVMYLHGCRGSSKPKYVVLILLDAARADRFSSYGYKLQTTPEIDQLAKDGVIFLNHFSQASHTRSALPSMLYSRYFSKPLFPANPDVPFSGPQDLFAKMDEESISIPAAFARSGYRTCMISAHTWIQAASPFASEFNEFHNLSADLSYPREQTYPSADQVIDYATDWIQKNQDRQFFLYVHLMDTHFPHFMKPDVEAFLKIQNASLTRPSRFAVSGWPDRSSVPLTREERIYIDALYNGNLRFVDRSLGPLFQLLKSSRFRNETLIALTSDHGEFLLEQPDRFAHGGPWYDVVARVPLILYYPKKLRSGRVSSMSEHVDLLPTLLELSDMELPAGKRTDGRSLLTLIGKDTESRDYVFSRDAIRSREYKCIFDADTHESLNSENPSSVSSLKGELYDLESDPGETKNLWDSSPQIVEKMFVQYQQRLREPYQKYISAKTEEQPRSAFAIKSSYFWIEPVDPSGKKPLNLDEEASVGKAIDAKKNQWISIKDSENFYLLATPGAPALDVFVRVPDGIYLLTAALVGKAHIRLPDRNSEIAVQSSALPELSEIISAKTEKLSLGAVKVSDKHLHMTIRGDEQHPFLVRYFGFSPVLPEGEKIPDIDEEQLRALGYIQ